MYILGISAFYHDSAAALIKNGKVIAAAEEERFSRIKHDNLFPFRAINFCLSREGIAIPDLAAISYYEKPLLKFERIIETFVSTYPRSFSPFLKGMPEWLGEKIKIQQIIKKKLGYEGKIYFIPHHASHAAACFFPSPFKSSAILTVDGVGEYQTTGLWKGSGIKITPFKEIHFPHSLGLFYSTATAFLGFKINEDEYKMMGLAAYGKPTLVDKVKKLIRLREDESFNLDLSYFAFRETFQMWSRKFEKLFGPPRKPNQPVTQRDKNLAASVQTVTEEVYFKMLNHLYVLTKSKNICVSGGVALNALANGKIYQKTPFKNVYIFGPAGDNGTAAGCALFTYHSIFKKLKRQPISDLRLGSEYDNDQIESLLKEYKLKYQKFKNGDELVDKTARLLAKNKTVGWFQGRMEYGPRALGARSILANPQPRWMKEKVNVIKRREQFRPFAGSILQEKAHEYFDVPEKNHRSPFMVFCFEVKKNKKNELAAIVHPDNTCRIQTVSKENGRYYKLIKKFSEITGTPCILNTSFNLKGEPIVENPRQAIEDYIKTKLDHLIIEDFLVK